MIPLFGKKPQKRFDEYNVENKNKHNNEHMSDEQNILFKNKMKLHYKK